MFWISKKSNYLELWKDGFVDIHNHLLPGIDDGSKSIKHTNAMVQGMQELGITEAFATPHTYPGMWENDIESISKAFKKADNPFISGYSSEYFTDTHLLDLANNNQLISLKDNFLLIEFSMMSAPVDELMDILFALKIKDYKLILAHPERYIYWEKNLAVFEQLKSFDLHFQLNVLSLLGFYGAKCKKLSEYLLENDFYEFLGTDFHSVHHIEYTKKNTFPEKYLKKLAPLVEANNFFSTK